jgi:hypothetical protein
MLEIRTEGTVFEKGIIREAAQRLTASASLVPALEDFEALHIRLVVSFAHGQSEDGLLSWRDGTAIASLAQRYTLADLDRLPIVLAHEVLGHALWEAKARRQNVHAAVRFHLNGELIALVTGWIAALELGLEPPHPGLLRDFSSSPDSFARDLPLMSPHYVLLLSTEEMRHVRRTLQDRLNVLTQEWIGLRSEGLSGGEVEIRERSLGEMIRLVTETLGNLDREGDQASERWFADCARCDLVLDLDRSTELLSSRLRAILDLS